MILSLKNKRRSTLTLTKKMFTVTIFGNIPNLIIIFFTVNYYREKVDGKNIK